MRAAARHVGLMDVDCVTTRGAWGSVCGVTCVCVVLQARQRPGVAT